MYVALKEYAQAAQLFGKFYRETKKENLSLEEKEYLDGYARRSGEFYLKANNIQAAAKIYAEAGFIQEAIAAFLGAVDVPRANQVAQ
jgi:hypothetical protein